MKKISTYIKEYWLFFIIITQPILDIIAFFSFDEYLTPVSFAIRSIYLIFIVLYCFIKVKERKKLFLCLLPFGILSFLHILNSYRLSGLNLFDDLRYLVLVMQMPVVAISLIFYVKGNQMQSRKIEKGVVVAFVIIAISILLSVLTNTYKTTYEYYGITGWFTSPNTQSMILSIIAPLSLYYFSKKENYIYFVGLTLIFLVLYLNGTRACYYTLIALLCMFTYVFAAHKNTRAKLFTTILCLILAIGFYNISFTSSRADIVDESTEINKKILEELDKYQTKEEKINALKQNYLYRKMIFDFGEDKVYDEMKDKITAYNLSNTRLVKRTYAKLIFQDCDLITKIVGFNHYEIEKYGMDLENDITAILYYYGYLGFIMYISFLLYFVVKAIKLIIRNPIVLFSSKFLTLSFTFALGILGGEYSGALLRKSNANIYMALVIVLYYIYIRNKMEDRELKNSKLTFLLLHLGYGGIESSTINTVNSLCNKYDIEIISFYKLSNNQSNKLNKRVKVKYLYNGGPNREEFMKSLNEHNYINTLKEGIKAVDILLRKKLLMIRSIVDSDAKYIVSTRWEFSILLSRYGNKNCIKIAQEHHYHNNDKKYINVLSKKYKNINYLCALTKTLEEDYRKILKDNHYTKVVLLPNMITEIPEVNSSLNEKNIITISRLDYGKRNNEIIKSFSKIKEEDWKLYIIGDGKEYNNLTNLVKELKLEDRVILTGYKDKKEIEKYMLKSSVFLMASVSEGLPMVLLEAMSYGIPCIAYETASGVSDIIDDGKNGYIIKNRKEEDYIEKIEELINDETLRKQMGKNAKESVNNFSKEEIKKIWLELLNEEK